MNQLIRTSSPCEQVDAAIKFVTTDAILNEAILSALVGLWLPGCEALADEELINPASDALPADLRSSLTAADRDLSGLASLIDLEKGWTSDPASRAGSLLARVKARLRNDPELDRRLCEDAGLLIFLKRKFKDMDIVTAMDHVAANGL